MFLLFAVPHGVQVGDEYQTQTPGGDFIGRYRILPRDAPQGNQRAGDCRGKTDNCQNKRNFYEKGHNP